MTAGFTRQQKEQTFSRPGHEQGSYLELLFCEVVLGSVGLQALHFPLNGRTESGHRPSTLGINDINGTSNFYVEDCDFHGGIGVSDFDSNSKFVFRHNILTISRMASHGIRTHRHAARATGNLQ